MSRPWSSAEAAIVCQPMKVSIAMATYNGGVFLREQLSSLRGQTLLPDELVVSDDGSTDDTLDVVRAFSHSAPFPVRILDKSRRLGFSDNFLNAAESCRHDVIAFCDQDDVWLPAKLETGLRRMQDDGSLLAMHRLTLVDEQLRPSGEIWTQGIESDQVFEPLALDPYLNGWGNSMMVRRELIQLVPRASRPRHPERNHLPLSHDTWMYVLAAALGRVSHIATPLLLYRQHSSNAEGVKSPSWRYHLFKKVTGQAVRLREQSRFNRAMVDIFAEVGGRDAEPMATAARRASAEFAVRRDLLAKALELYAGASFGVRLRAFRCLNDGSLGPRPRAIARLKQLIMGVAGVNKVVDRPWRRPPGRA